MGSLLKGMLLFGHLNWGSPIFVNPHLQTWQFSCEGILDFKALLALSYNTSPMLRSATSPATWRESRLAGTQLFDLISARCGLWNGVGREWEGAVLPKKDDQEFVNVLNHTDLDPIYFCEARYWLQDFYQCPSVSNVGDFYTLC